MARNMNNYQDRIWRSDRPFDWIREHYGQQQKAYQDQVKRDAERRRRAKLETEREQFNRWKAWEQYWKRQREEAIRRQREANQRPRQIGNLQQQQRARGLPRNSPIRR